MSSPALPAPRVEEIKQITRTLTRLVVFLRSSPAVPDVQPLLEPLFRENDGVPTLLSDTLRITGRLVSGQAAIPWTAETYRILRTLSKAAQEFMAWHVLDWDICSLDSLEYDELAAAPHWTQRGLSL